MEILEKRMRLLTKVMDHFFKELKYEIKENSYPTDGRLVVSIKNKGPKILYSSLDFSPSKIIFNDNVMVEYSDLCNIPDRYVPFPIIISMPPHIFNPTELNGFNST